MHHVNDCERPSIYTGIVYQWYEIIDHRPTSIQMTSRTLDSKKNTFAQHQFESKNDVLVTPHGVIKLGGRWLHDLNLIFAQHVMCNCEDTNTLGGLVSRLKIPKYHSHYADFIS